MTLSKIDLAQRVWFLGSSFFPTRFRDVINLSEWDDEEGDSIMVGALRFDGDDVLVEGIGDEPLASVNRARIVTWLRETHNITVKDHRPRDVQREAEAVLSQRYTVSRDGARLVLSSAVRTIATLTFDGERVVIEMATKGALDRTLRNDIEMMLRDAGIAVQPTARRARRSEQGR